jgi:hypothetical protein
MLFEQRMAGQGTLARAEKAEQQAQQLELGL